MVPIGRARISEPGRLSLEPVSFPEAETVSVTTDGTLSTVTEWGCVSVAVDTDELESRDNRPISDSVAADCPSMSSLEVAVTLCLATVGSTAISDSFSADSEELCCVSDAMEPFAAVGMSVETATLSA